MVRAHPIAPSPEKKPGGQLSHSDAPATASRGPSIMDSKLIVRVDLGFYMDHTLSSTGAALATQLLPKHHGQGACPEVQLPFPL